MFMYHEQISVDNHIYFFIVIICNTTSKKLQFTVTNTINNQDNIPD